MTGVVWRPRSTMAAVVAAPTFLTTWAFLLLLWLLPAVWLLSTAVGQQALVDERVRLSESFGATVDDASYAAWQARPPWGVYLITGGRYLIAPPITLLAGLGLAWLARADGVALGWVRGLAIAVHASFVLVLEQWLAAPLQYWRESIASPANLAAWLPLMEDGSTPARVFGAVDVFGLWWVWLLALGLAGATGRPARRYAWRLGAVYLAVAVVLAAIMTASGGS